MDDQQVKAGAVLLWALMGAQEDQLDKFRRQRLGRSSKVELEHIERVREMLRSLVTALRDDREEAWQRVEEAWRLLKTVATMQDPPSVPEEDPSPIQANVPIDVPAAPPPSDAPALFAPPRAPSVTRAPVPMTSPWARPGPTFDRLEPPTRPSAPSATPTTTDAQSEAAAAADPHATDRTAELPEIDPLEHTTDVDHIPKLVLPFQSSAIAVGAERPRLDDPEAATMKMRAHVLPFRKAPVADPPAAPRASQLPKPRAPKTKTLAYESRRPTKSSPAGDSADTLAETLLPEAETTLPSIERRPATERKRRAPAEDTEHTALVEIPLPPNQSAGVEGGAGSAFEAVERYAALCAECSVSPERIAEIRHVYGVDDEEVHEDLDLLWNERFGDDPSLLKVWDERFQVLRAELLAARKR